MRSLKQKQQRPNPRQRPQRHAAEPPKAEQAKAVHAAQAHQADAAKKNFETVIASTDDSPQAERQKSIANIGLALCLVADKKYDEAIKSLERIAREAGSEDSSFQALVYNSLGSAYNQADKPRDAVLAYMHTDILFSAARSEHIKALTELSKLWAKIQRSDRAEDVAKRLKDQYNIAVK